MTLATYQNTLIVLALESEARDQFEGLNVLFTGIGKVNAAYKLMRKLVDWQGLRGAMPALVLNVGSAGSIKFPTGSIVNCTRFVQRDFDVTVFGHAPYMTPYEDAPIILANGIRYSAFAEGICGTGDNFATSGMMPDWDVADMEAYALAKTCLLENIPFAALKYITDGADGNASHSWKLELGDTAKHLRAAVDTVFAPSP